MTNQVYQYAGGSGTTAIPNAPIFSPRDPVDNQDTVSPNGNPYQLLQGWKNTTSGAVYEYVGSGQWILVSAAGGDAIETLTGNTGGAISPVLGNVNILGNGQATFVGSGNTLTLTQTAGGYPITPYVVGPVGKAGYQTIASAIAAAGGAGGGLVFIQPGTYTENLTLVNGVDLLGADVTHTTITGVHTPPASGAIQISNLTLTSATSIFSSAVAGSTSIFCNQCLFTVANGYVFSLLNWTGLLNIDDCGSNGTTDGFVNNTGGAPVKVTNATLGAGTGNSFTASGVVTLDDALINCPINFVTGASFTAQYVIYNKAVTCSNNSTGVFTNSRFSTGATAAITQSSSGTILVTECSINTPAHPALAGAGAGVLSLGNITYQSGSIIASTLTIKYLRAINRSTPYVVGASGNYTTIQAAVIAAAAAGGGVVFVQPGTYTESLTLSDTVDIVGASVTHTTIIGVHTPPASGNIQFSCLTLSSATSIFSSAVAGSTNIFCGQCLFTVTSGYVFNLLNWTGLLNVDDCGSNGTTDGFVNNTGGASIKITSANIGAGTGNSFTASGVIVLDDVIIACPVNFVTGASYSIDICTFSRTITCSNNSTGYIANSYISTGATAAITYNSSANTILSDVTINSSNNPAIAGTSAGQLIIGSVTFMSNSTIAGTVTQTNTSVFQTGTVRAAGSDMNGTVNINTSGAGVTTIGTGGTGAVNIGNATGNTAVTGSLTATTTLTASSGAITASSGNFVASAAGSGLLLNVTTGSGAAGGSVACNGRAGAVTFTGPSTAGGADSTLTMTNTSITGSGTAILYSLSGVTTGAALSIKSVTNSASQSVIVVTNGAALTTSTADITLTFLVLN